MSQIKIHLGAYCVHEPASLHSYATSILYVLRLRRATHRKCVVRVQPACCWLPGERTQRSGVHYAAAAAGWNASSRSCTNFINYAKRDIMIAALRLWLTFSGSSDDDNVRRHRLLRHIGLDWRVKTGYCFSYL